MPKKQKDIKVIITFDDKEYSEEETAILYQQFFESLAKIKGVEIPEYTGKALAKALRAKEKHLKKLEPLKLTMQKSFSNF